MPVQTMARADYIYLIEVLNNIESSAYSIEAAFTVRHEMLNYLDKNELLKQVGGDVRVFRMPDNPANPDDRIYYTREELEKMRRKAA